MLTLPGDLPRESRMRHYLSIVALTLALVALVCTAPAEDEKAPSPPGGLGGLGGLGGGDFTETLRNFGECELQPRRTCTQTNDCPRAIQKTF